MIKVIENLFNRTSLLAIFSLFLAIILWLPTSIDRYVYHLQDIGFSCLMIQYSLGIASLSGIIALLHMRKTHLKGKWFAILTVIMGLHIMGLHGFLAFGECEVSIFQNRSNFNDQE